MARLTPLAKGILALSIVSVAGAAAWNLGLRELIEKKQGASPGAGAEPPADGKPAQAASGSSGSSGSSGALGSATNPLKVSIVSFHGYAPALVANGKSLRTQPGSIFAREGVQVEFVIQDNIPQLHEIFESKAAHCAWRTSDFWAQEQPNLRNAGGDGRAIMIVDNTRGADAVVAVDPSIQRIEDLADRKVALLQFTPSHGMVIDAIDNSSLTAKKKQSIKFVYVNADEGTAGVRATLQGKQVDAIALWDPDLSLAIKNVPGAHVIYSTKSATNLIYDVIVCDKRVIDAPGSEAVLQAFVTGWMSGVEESKKNPELAIDALVETEEFFTLLAKDQGRGFVKELFQTLLWTGLDDNARILGLAGDTNHYARVYKRFDQIYREAGALANPNSAVINPEDSFDLRFIKALLARAPEAETKAKKPEFTFSDTERSAVKAKPASVTKPVTVSFNTGSAELSKRAERTIDLEMVPLIENNGSAYFEVSGNTDSTGARAANLKLSRARADAVVDYLVKQWEFPRARFEVIGNGPDRPLCNEKALGEEGVDLEECRSRNRSTRLAVHAR